MKTLVMNKIDYLLAPPTTDLNLVIIEMAVAFGIFLFAIYLLQKIKPEIRLKTKFMAILEIFNAATAIFAIAFLLVRFSGIATMHKAAMASDVVEAKIEDLKAYSTTNLDACKISFGQASKIKNNHQEVLDQDSNCISLFNELLNATDSEQSIGRFIELKNKFKRTNDDLSTGGWKPEYENTIKKLDYLTHDLKIRILYTNPQPPKYEIWIVVVAFLLLSASLITKLFKAILEYKEISSSKN